MPSPLRIKLGPFYKGLNFQASPYLLDPSEPATAYAVDLNSGSIKGAYKPGTSISATVGNFKKFAAYAGKDHWVATAYPDWACNDSDDASGNGRTYRTAHATDTTAGWPIYAQAATDYRLGLDYVTTAPTATAGARSLNRSYAVTFYSPTTGFESNPTDRTAAVKSGASLSGIPTYATATPGSGTIYRRIYATKEGDENGTLYLYDTIANNTDTTYTDAGGSVGAYAVSSTILNWGAGGNVDSTTTPYDHSPPPNLTVLAEGFMGTDGDTGVLFGAAGSVVRWSQTGKPSCWPIVQDFDVQEYVEAIVSWQGQAYAFTASAVWVFSGAADYAIIPNKTSSAIGVKAGFGKTCKATPFGILYQAREGLALFDGANSRIIVPNLKPVASCTYGNAAYFDGIYYLNHWGTVSLYVVDLQNGLSGLNVTLSGEQPGDLHVTPFTNGTLGMDSPGMYFIDYSNNAIKPWRQLDGADVPGAVRGTWRWDTGALTGPSGEPHPETPKRFERVRVMKKAAGGNLNFTIAVGDDLQGDLLSTGTSTFTAILTDASPALFWLPAGMVGRAAKVSMIPDAAGAEVWEVELMGTYLNES